MSFTSHKRRKALRLPLTPHGFKISPYPTRLESKPKSRTTLPLWTLLPLNRGLNNNLYYNFFGGFLLIKIVYYYLKTVF